MSFDTSRLYSTLLSSRIQQDNNALYQVIYQLIGALVDTQKFINSFGDGGTDDVINNQVNNIYQIINRGGEGGSSGKTIPGPKGDTGSAGLNGASLPGPLGIIKHYVESYPCYIPIMGNAGNPGTTGASGPIGPVVPSRVVEVVRSPIQIFQGSTGSGNANLSTDSIATSETQASGAAYGNLATTGPSVTLNMTGTVATIWISGIAFRNGVGFSCFMAVEVSGATTVAAADGNAAQTSSYAANNALIMSRNFKISGLNPGSNTFTVKYRNDGGGVNWNFFNRGLTVYAP